MFTYFIAIGPYLAILTWGNNWGKIRNLHYIASKFVIKSQSRGQGKYNKRAHIQNRYCSLDCFLSFTRFSCDSMVHYGFFKYFNVRLHFTRKDIGYTVGDHMENILYTKDLIRLDHVIGSDPITNLSYITKRSPPSIFNLLSYLLWRYTRIYCKVCIIIII